MIEKKYDNDMIILFDGVCNLCNGAVQFIIKWDHKKRFKFASLQSDSGQELLKSYGENTKSFESLIFIDRGTVYKKSTGALRIGRLLGGMWPLVGLGLVIPGILRDPVYTAIAMSRYQFFGKQDSCMIPQKEILDRFL